MLNKTIMTTPAARPAGTSNLSLLNHASCDAERVARATLPKNVRIDVSQWRAFPPGRLDYRIVAFEIDLDKILTGNQYMTVCNLFNSGNTFYRSWIKLTTIYAACDPETGEIVDAPDQEAPPPLLWAGPYARTGDDPPNEPDLAEIGPGLQAMLSAMDSVHYRYIAAAGYDFLAGVRHLDDMGLRAFLQWAFSNSNFCDNTASVTIDQLYAAYLQEIEDTANNRLPGVAGIARLAGAGRIVAVRNITDDVTGDALCTDGRLYCSIALTRLGLEPNSPAYYAVRIARYMRGEVLHALNYRNGPDNTFGDVPPEDLAAIASFINEDMVNSVEMWERICANFRAVATVPVVEVSGNETFGWARLIVTDGAFVRASDIVNACNYGQSMTIGAVDIEEFAKTSVPENPLVESVRMLKNGKIRVVLREPVYPETVQRRGVIYAENEPGTVLSYMAVHAFDLDFRGTLTQFPNATAYEDAECTKTARHTNITGSGSVCLGDINTLMSEAEIAARGGVAMPCVADFVQMLRQCNLDSAYHRSRDFVLADPDIVTEAQYNAREWNIPGLYRVSSQMDDFKKMLEQMTAASPAAVEPQEGTQT